jgi:hypothetical protein|tara:strand:+ start:3000 stop:3191 length:192 start_codon:yes stop_codon:yes gene_type:complete
MMKVGDIVQSNFRGPRNVEGALGIVLEIKETPFGRTLGRVLYPETRKTGWVNSVDMRVISASR